MGTEENKEVVRRIEAAFLGAPANDATIDVPFISIYTLRDGKVVRHFGLNDAVALMVQLGVMPPPGG